MKKHAFLPRFDSTAWTWTAAAQAADSGIARMMRDPWTPVFLYYKRGDVTTRTMQDAPDGMTRLDEPLPVNRDRDGLTAWIFERLKSAPCLPYEAGELARKV